MKHNIALRLLSLSALLLAALAPAGARAQDEAPPEPVPVEATPVPAEGDGPRLIAPNQVAAGEIWQPTAGHKFTSLQGVTARVDAPYAVAAQGYFYIYDPKQGYGPQRPATTVLSNNNRRAHLTAMLSPGDVPPGGLILFEIGAQNGTITTTSPLYGFDFKTFLPLIGRNFGYTSVVGDTVLDTGTSACDALNNQKGGPLQPFVNYLVQNTRTDSWLFGVNTIPNATVIVSLTNYTSVTGQLQVYREQAGCATLAAVLGLGSNPNPEVILTNVPTGTLYFRVVSASGQPAPPPYRIRWRNYAPGVDPFEDDDTPCQAAPTQPGVTYLRFSDDQHDFFSLNVNGPALVQVTVLSHMVSGAQAQVRSPLKPGFVCPGNGDDPVNSTDRIGAFGVVPSGGGNTQFVVDLPPGNAQYYIRVSLPSAGNGQPYYLRWEFISANGAPATRDPLFNSNPSQPYLPPYNGDTLTNIPTGTMAVYYWSGMQGLWPYDSIQVQINGTNTLVGCPTGNPAATVPNTFANTWASVGTVPRGRWAVQFNMVGGYVIKIRVMQGSMQKFYDEKPLKVGCG